MKRVIIVGASGLIGTELLNLLLDNKNITEVVALIRSPLQVTNAKLIQIITDFDLLEKVENELYGDAIYCCLGSTRSKTPDKIAYRKVDYDYPLELAKLSAGRIDQFHLVSALGADVNSNIFYNKLKGEIERDIKQTIFKTIYIYQPSLIVGNRKEIRPFEKLGIAFMALVNPFLIGNLKKYRSIKAITIAQTMINLTFKKIEGIHIYPSHIIKQLA